MEKFIIFFTNLFPVKRFVFVPNLISFSVIILLSIIHKKLANFDKAKILILMFLRLGNKKYMQVEGKIFFSLLPPTLEF